MPSSKRWCRACPHKGNCSPGMCSTGNSASAKWSGSFDGIAHSTECLIRRNDLFDGIAHSTEWLTRRSGSFAGRNRCPRGHNFFRVLLAPWLQEDLPDHALLVDKKGRAVQPHIFPPIQLLLPPHPILVDDLVIGVGDKRKGQPEFLPEFLVALLIVGAYTDDREPFLLQQGEIVAEVAGLHRAGGSIILGIEVKRHFLSLMIGQRDLVAGGILPGKDRGLVSFLQMRHRCNFFGE